jgi:murein DD-endopeptidase MepM/ murein hydrolase activator NlpD
MKLLAAVCALLLASCASGKGLIKQASLAKPANESSYDAPATSGSHTSPEEGAFHIVGKEETLEHICEVYGLDLTKVASINNLSKPYSVKLGQEIFLPAEALLSDAEASGKAVARAKSGTSRASCGTQSAGAVVNAIRGKRDPSVPDLSFPVPQGTLTSPFGFRWGRFHRGLDIAAPVGTPVLACADAKVIFTGSRKRFRRYGNTVLLDHGKGVYTYYAHLSRILVKKSQKVRRGQSIALVGNTGRSTGPHLHLEVRVANNLFNPLAYFSPADLVGTRMAKRFSESPMGPVRARWDIPDLVADGR